MIDLSEFFEIQTRLLKLISRAKRRAFIEKINWDIRLSGIIGARGTGKTTILLQRLVDEGESDNKHLYISADHIRVQALGIYEIASSFFKLGGQSIFIDEIHKFNNWAQEIKNIYDAFPEAKIRFSGSSAIALQSGISDLSRRAVLYTLSGLSFREYLFFAEGIFSPQISLPVLLEKHFELAKGISEKGPILGYFRDYIDHGVYPYFLEGITEYLPRMLNILEKIFYEDIPSSIGVKTAYIPVIKRILWLVATSQPFTPNIEKMSRDLNISKEFVYIYLDALERARLLISLLPAESGYRLVRKPSKIYIENTNLLKALAGNIGIEAMRGILRETFFAQQIKGSGSTIAIPKKGDFLVDNKYLFEVGGRSKGRSQIEAQDNSYIVKDDIEIGNQNVIPLWLFGFLY
ncbi:MAG: ATP-binding protein [Deltaproteobacteria bacterium]|nr:ATP-binding protein [Deltaproteobacteria bacterium]